MNVYQALTKQLKTCRTLPVYQEMNKTLTLDKADVKWCRATLISTESGEGAMGVNGYLIQNGLYQIDIFTPVGSGDDYDLVDQIKAVFLMGTQLDVNDQVLTVEKCWGGDSKEGDAYLMTSVVVKWFMAEARVNE